MPNVNRRVFLLCLAIAVLPILLCGCGQLKVTVKTIFGGGGGCERSIDFAAQGIFVKAISRADVDGKLKKDGWSIRNYTEGDIEHKVCTRTFGSPSQITSPGSILQADSGVSRFQGYGKGVSLVRKTSFLFNYYNYEERIDPVPELAGNTCAVCSGTGTRSCPECSGTGFTKCVTCAGVGSVSVPNPGTAGTQTVACSSCAGSGRVRCSVCGGGGRAACPVCAGTGKAGEMQKNAEDTVKSMIKLQNQIELPGEIVASNADDVQGGNLCWDVTFDRLETGMVMRAQSRQVNWLSLQAVGIVLIGACVLIVMVTRRRRTPPPTPPTYQSNWYGKR